MDDQFTYLLSGLLTRHFALGRVARFRQVARGRQAATYEVLTAQQNEYLVQLYPGTYPADQLAFIAAAVNRLDEARFSVVPFLKTREGSPVVGGPQGTQMLVSLNPAGSPRPAGGWTDQQRSELGLRLAWMHRALREELPVAGEADDLADELEDARAVPADRLPKGQPALAEADLGALAREVEAAGGEGLGHVHGDVNPEALLVDADEQLRVILDWGLMRPGVPAEDLFWTFVTVAGRDVEKMRWVLEAYTSMEPLDAAAVRAAVPRALARRIVEARAGRTSLRGVAELLAERAELTDTLARALG